MLFIMALIRRFGIGIAAAVFTYYLISLFLSNSSYSTEQSGDRLGITIGAGLLGFFLPRIMTK